MSLSSEAQALFDHARNALPRWLTSGASAALEMLYAYTDVFDATRTQAQTWVDNTYLDNATGSDLDQHAADRGTSRRSGESDVALRQRLKNITDAVTEPALKSAIDKYLIQSLVGDKLIQNFGPDGGTTDGIRHGLVQSANQLTGDGYIEVVVGTYSRAAFGLCPPTNTISRDAGYMFEPIEGTDVWVREFGVDKGPKTTWTAGTILRVRRTGTTITYEQGNTVVYTSLTPSSGPLAVDFAFLYLNSYYTNVRMFDATTNSFVDIDWQNVSNVATGPSAIVNLRRDRGHLFNPYKGAYPTTAANMKTASANLGTWTNAFLCDEASGNLNPTFGSSFFFPDAGGGSPIYNQGGPLGPGDPAVGVTVAGTGFIYNDLSGADVNGTSDFIATFIVKTSTLSTSTYVASKNNFVGGPGWWLTMDYPSYTVTFGVSDGTHAVYGVTPANAFTPNTWIAITICLDRSAGGTGRSRVAVTDLASGKVVTSVEYDTSTVGSLSDLTSPFRIQRAGSLGSNPILYSAIFWGTGVNAASGASANLASVAASFLKTIRPNIATTFLSRGFRMTNVNRPMGYVVILPYGSTAANAKAVSEIIRQLGPAGYYAIVETRDAPP